MTIANNFVFAIKLTAHFIQLIFKLQLWSISNQVSLLKWISKINTIFSSAFFNFSAVNWFKFINSVAWSRYCSAFVRSSANFCRKFVFSEISLEIKVVVILQIMILEFYSFSLVLNVTSSETIPSFSLFSCSMCRLSALFFESFCLKHDSRCER